MEKRILSLDGVRAIAILSVILTHTWYSPESPLLDNLAKQAQAGVDLFFVLSGFLITGVLLEARGREGYYGNFYGRRVLRIFPVYFLVLTLIFVFWPNSPYLAQPRAYWPWYFLMASNIILAITGPQLKMTDITWSLAVEEQFYFVWPTVVRRLTIRSLTVACLGIIVLVPALRLLAHGHLSPLAIHFLTPFRIDEFAVGALICIIRREHWYTQPQLCKAGWMLLVTAGLLFFGTSVLGMVEGWYCDAIHYSVTGAAAGGLLLLALYSPKVGATLQNRALVHIGAISYGMYLFHEILFIAIQKAAEVAHLHSSSLLGSIASFLAVSLASIAAASLSYRYFESPVLRLKRFFVNRPKSESIPATSSLSI